jgi:CheY-like chemotaxis protein
VTASTPQKPIEILVIEDNPGDVILMREALRRTAATLTTTCNGEEALEILRKRTTSAEVSPPDLILLDLHLPRMNGYDVLEEIRKDAALRAIPVVVFSSSDAERDILKSYELGANCYVPKPFDLAEFNKVIGSIMQFWLKTAQLPKRQALAEKL